MLVASKRIVGTGGSPSMFEQHCVQIDLGKDVHDHFITPEERLNLAMARQWASNVE
jgi:hypothetical protein